MSVKVELHRVKDVARILSISEWEVRRLLETGELHRRYIGESGRFYRVTAPSVDAYLASLKAERKASV